MKLERAPTHHNWRKSAHSNEDPIQPKTNKILKKKQKNYMQNMSLYDPHGFSNLKTALILKLKYDDAKTKKQKKKQKQKNNLGQGDRSRLLNTTFLSRLINT